MSDRELYNIFLSALVNEINGSYRSRSPVDLSYNNFSRPSRRNVDSSYNRSPSAPAPIRQPSSAPIRQPTIEPAQTPNDVLYRLWLQYNDNINNYQRIMENHVFPNISDENDYSSVFNIYNTNIYNYQYNFNNIINHLSFAENTNNNNHLSPEEIIDEHINNINQTPTSSTEPSTTTYNGVENFLQSVNSEHSNMYNYYILRNGRRIYQYIQGSYDIPDEPEDNAITDNQINIATQLIPYNLSMSNTSCPISYVDFLEGDEVCQIKHCKHIFKKASLLNWLQNYSSCCPVCRYDLRTYATPLSERSESQQNVSHSNDNRNVNNNENNPNYIV